MNWMNTEHRSLFVTVPAKAETRSEAMKCSIDSHTKQIISHKPEGGGGGERGWGGGAHHRQRESESFAI